MIGLGMVVNGVELYQGIDKYGCPFGYENGWFISWAWDGSDLSYTLDPDQEMKEDERFPKQDVIDYINAAMLAMTTEEFEYLIGRFRR